MTTPRPYRQVREDVEMPTYPAPHEGVTGMERDPHLLSLDEGATATRRFLVALIDEVWRSCLVGNQAPSVRERYDRMKDPQVGDFVRETTASFGDDRLIKGVGFLVARRTEWFHTDGQWAEQEVDYEGYPRPTDEVWYIQYGPAPADVCRWTNCDFIAAPVPVGNDQPDHEDACPWMDGENACTCPDEPAASDQERQS